MPNTKGGTLKAPVFGAAYSEAYDKLYRDKPYPEECDLIEKAIARFGTTANKRVLDLGCGTGGHAIELVRRGYKVTGVDRSSDMITIAKEKAEQSRLSESLNFICEDIKYFASNEEFDLAIMMFAVLSYQTDNSDVKAALRTVRRHLKPGGLFVFDVWYGPAVLAERPSERVAVFQTDSEQFIRVAKGELDTGRHLCRVNYRLWKIDDGRLVSEVSEEHSMRFYFPLELSLLLEYSSLELVNLSEFGTLDGTVGENTWNVLGVARAE